MYMYYSYACIIRQYIIPLLLYICVCVCVCVLYIVYLRRHRHLVPERRRVLRVKRALSEPAAYARAVRVTGGGGMRKQKKNKQTSTILPKNTAADSTERAIYCIYSSLPGRILTVCIRPTLNVILCGPLVGIRIWCIWCLHGCIKTICCILLCI
jgi:hypothetical protein